MKRVLVIAVVASVGKVPPLAAQDFAASVSRWFSSPRVVDYRLSASRYSAGPLSFVPFGQLAMQGTSDDGAALLGVGGEVTIRLSDAARPYLIGGASGGFLDFRSTAGLGLWGAWSAGLGAEVLRLGGVGLGFEARYQELTRLEADGFSVGLRIGASVGSRRKGRSSIDPAASVESPTPLDSASSGSTGEAAPSMSTLERRAEVVETAMAAMGAPYRWGGSDANGFDCSGLIRYAYASLGLQLPRRSADQARIGFELPLDPAKLAPGDILAFSVRVGGEVSHVGLYLGEGRFLHSASGGVRISQLDGSEPDGRWWRERWVGARRVLGGLTD